MQQSTERDTNVAFQRLSIIPETPKHRNELKELTTPFKTKFMQPKKSCAKKEETSRYKIDI